MGSEMCIRDRHNPAEGGVLDRLTTWRAPPVQSEPTIFEEVEIEPELEEPTEMFEEEELELVEDTSPIDDFEMEEEDEPADLWDDDEEDSWNDEFEVPDEIWNTPEEPEPLEVEEERLHQAEQIPEPEPTEPEPSEVYQRADDESGFYFVEEGTEPPELPEYRKPKGNFGRLLGRTQQANDRMPTIGDDTPIQVAEPHKSLVPKTPVREMPPASVEDEHSTARIDTSVQSGAEESVFHDDQSVWIVDQDSKSTLPDDPRVFQPIVPEPEPIVEEIETEWFVDDGPAEEMPEEIHVEIPEPVPEPIFEPEPSQVSIPAIPVTPPPPPVPIPPQTPVQVPVQVPVSLGPTWEPDLPFNPIVLQTLTEAERMIVEASSTREVSPSDDELQARLEVGRSRLSQIYNGMRRKGLLSVRKQGRTRYFKLSEAANQHLRGAPQEAA